MTARTAVFPRTKFHRPQVRDEHVERSRLLDAIATSGARVVNVTAPAGFGKSTLLAQWAARCERVAWVQLDDDDRGPRLWAAVLTALAELVEVSTGAGRGGGAGGRPAHRRADRAAGHRSRRRRRSPWCSTTCTWSDEATHE